jgi:RNA polymerase sigma-70 factor (ECF subfamily)
MYHLTTTTGGSARSSVASKENPAPGPQAAAYDAMLVRRFNEGDESAFAEIMHRYHPRILTIVRRCLNNASDAEDIAQDTFIRAHRGLANFRGEAALSTWLYRIAVNLARNRYWYFFRRHRQSTVSLDRPVSDGNLHPLAEILAADTSSPRHLTIQNEFVDLVAECISRLDEPHREILTMRNMLHYSYEEIGNALGINTGTVKSRVARAREKLRALILESAPEFSREAGMEDFFEPLREPAQSPTHAA